MAPIMRHRWYAAHPGFPRQLGCTDMLSAPLDFHQRLPRHLHTFQLEEADQLRLSDLLPGANFADICTDGNILLDFLLCHTILRQMDLFGSSLASLYGGMHSKRDQYWSYFCVNEKSESLLCLRSFLSSRAVRFRGTAAISIPSTGAAGGRWPPWSGWRRHLPPPPKAPGPG